MKYINLIIFLFVFSLLSACKPGAEENDKLKLWYEQPASSWVEALPIGNGRLGAMIYGGESTDHIQFNEETLWTGRPHDYSHEGASEYLGTIRKLLWEGKQKEAEKLALEKFMSVPLHQEKYQPFGDLWLEFANHDSITEFRRELDIANAICRTTYMTGGKKYTREYFASHPANLIVIRLLSDNRRSLSFDLKMTALHEDFKVTPGENNTLTLAVKVKNGVLYGSSTARVLLKGGKISCSEDGLHIENANEATILLSAATNFVSPNDVSGNPEALCAKHLEAAEGKSYEKLKKEHIEDYRKYFDRFSIDLGSSGKENLPTDKRINEIPVEMDNSLAALYVQYGRYLLLSSSREGSYPANLQGIWNDRLNPPWDSKYTVNINIEMNYWPAEMLNIAECHEALFRMIGEVVPAGSKVADDHYNARGWVLHHNTDIWRGAAPINASDHGIWVGGSGWMAHHYWEHFLFGRDTSFLRNTAWPVMKSAAMFYADFLVADPATGWLVSCPSNSPETGGLVSGPTMDHQIIKSLFRACIEADKILDANDAFVDTLESLLPRIAPYRIGRFGQLQEWMDDIDDPDNKHRHVSHLWGVHPGKEINWKDNPEFMEAARKSLEARGDEGTGWSLAWKINFWARFREGNHTWQMVRMLLRPQGMPAARATGGGSSGGGSYPNLFDAHPPFQIDGNFGGAAGIAEMLIQSHLDEIDILPSLPDAVPSGKIRGIRARGGFELDFEWDEGKLIDLKVKSVSGMPLFLNYNGFIFSSDTKKGEVLHFDGQLNRL
ncbi:MAG TPA: glycoside hydrolase N-terminal domain-containing protein [Bacteroidales bacterium]|nr:glycoside hydrolase N-terminal domain-containing protein [Bacteroidales bacterium]